MITTKSCAPIHLLKEFSQKPNYLNIIFSEIFENLRFWRAKALSEAEQELYSSSTPMGYFSSMIFFTKVGSAKDAECIAGL